MRGGSQTRSASITLTVLTGALACLAVLLEVGRSVSWAGGQSSNPADRQCGPPHYCARTDRETVPYPPTPPALGPAGSIITDPDFHSRILRVTDASSNRRRPGDSFVTPASSEQNIWNTTGTKFYVDDTNGRLFLWDFDPARMTRQEVGELELGWSGAQFSYSQPDILYGTKGQPPLLQQYDARTRKVSTINDPGSCVKFKASDYGTDISVSADDNTLMAVIGPEQDRNNIVYIYDRKQGCRWYNTQTGEIGGKWGPAGTVSIPQRFGVHNARISKSGNTVVIVAPGSRDIQGPLFWDVGTLNVTLCGKGYHCIGHHALGYSHFLNSGNSVHPLDFIVRPVDDLNAQTHLITDLPKITGWYDYHVSWNYVRPQDDTPACFSTYDSHNPVGPGAPLLTNAGAWENEIDCVETDGKASTIWRFAHTYSTGTSFWSTPRGNVSQDGRFFMFTSDWENELGQSSNPRQYRTDVFAVELR